MAEVFGIFECRRRAVLIQVGAINRVSDALTLCADSADRDFAVGHLDGAARLFEKRSVPTIRLQAP